MERYDIAIIGTGPAGLEAAITAKIRNKNIILFGNETLSKKVEKAHTIQNYLGLPNKSGESLKDAYLQHLETMKIQVTLEKIHTIYAMGEYFSIQGNGTEYEADTVILATGVSTAKPYPGEEQFLGRGVSYCATCDAPLYKGKTAAIIGFSKKEESEADFMAEIADKVYYIPMYSDKVEVADAISVVREKPVAVEGTLKVQELVTNENRYKVDGVFFLRDNIFLSQLLPGLAVENGHIAVDRNMSTNIAGCFACGDVTGTPYQYIKAAGEGNVAALSAVAYLAEKKRERKEMAASNDCETTNVFE